MDKAATTYSININNLRIQRPLCFVYSNVVGCSTLGLKPFPQQRQQHHENLRILKFRKEWRCLPVIRSIADETTSSTSSSPAKVADADTDTHTDPSRALKKKASQLSPDLKGTSIFLVGMKSSVKSNLGKLLAESLRYYYFDSDSLVEEAAGGASAAKAFRESDENGYRESETEVLRQLSSMGRLVVCAGNGAVQSPTNLALLRHGISIWIDVPLDILAREMSGVRNDLSASEMSSPDIYSQALSELTALYLENRQGYATADATVSLQKIAVRLGYDDLDAITTEDVALEVLKEIEKLTRVKKLMEEARKPF